jgi:hypothetical protein
MGITAAGFPASGRVVKASIWNIGMRTRELLTSIWTGKHCSPSNYDRTGGDLYNQNSRFYCYTEGGICRAFTGE